MGRSLQTCVPLAVGATAPAQVADVLDILCVDADMLPVVSTDLSHYLDQPTAERRDRHTAQAVVDRDAAAIGPDDACGVFALRGLVHWARRHDLDVRLLHLGTSADAGADPRRVVGYAAFSRSCRRRVLRSPRLAAANVNVDLAYTTFGGVRLVIATDDIRRARAALG